MEESPKRVSYFERVKDIRRMKELKAQLRKFESAFQEEGNNEKMDSFCMQGIKKIKAEMSQLTTRI
jgi:uncharacterized membrane protein (DUF106 family)